MLVDTQSILKEAIDCKYAVAAFNIYNLEGVIAVINAAEDTEIPVILQIHPMSFNTSGQPLISACLEAAAQSNVNIGVHFDHVDSEEIISKVIHSGIQSIMVDGSAKEYDDNIQFTRKCVNKIHYINGFVEAELGRLSGTEDELTVAEKDASMTNPDQLMDFCSKTQIDSLAVCVGNVHGKYFHDPNIDFLRLEKIRNNISIPLVMHGASGLPEDTIRRCINIGISKFNVNTELRNAYMQSIIEISKIPKSDILNIMNSSIYEMTKIAIKKIKLFASI